MFHGSIVALVTPMFEDGVIDYDSLTNLVEFHIEQGTNGIVAVGTTGESGTLSLEEKHHVIQHVVRAVRQRIPVIAGTGESSTSGTVELTKAALALGVDGCLILAPPYIKPTQEGLYQHYKTIAETVPLPLILYNVPGRTGCDILPETVARLAEIPNIVALKEATGSLDRLRQLIRDCSEQIDILSGEDALARETILAGGRGVISVTANVAPRAMSELCAAALSGDATSAAEIDATLAKLHQQLFIESNPIPVKWAVHQLGLMPKNGIRLPLLPLSERYQTGVLAAMQEAGVLEEKV